ncbi:hypothetical protein [Xenorhabdus sp. BG5]|uniref:hypothetical protein n=1 Tax=Xenorhabdus sp. BG5 TaxID=2782014 RepID=UPI00187F8211|nr:hypothetical protein [Xenorhabdus sp. BG5]MBE8595266.1 hypothetical protein [Xenorhabdus sp. BG5]
MARLLTKDEYIDNFIASEKQTYRVNWTRDNHLNTLILYEPVPHIIPAHLDLDVGYSGNLSALTYYPRPPSIGAWILFKYDLWYDTAFNQLPINGFMQDAVRRVMKYWTPHDWRGF